MTYDYRDEMYNDIVEWMRENKEIIKYQCFSHINDLEEWLNDILWTEDSVTGNASGSYTFNSWQAEEYLFHNLDLYFEACWNFGIDAERVVDDLQNPERMDVTIRCCLLSETVANVLNNLTEGRLEEYLVNDADNTEEVVVE